MNLLKNTLTITAMLSCLTLSACQKHNNQQENDSKQSSTPTEKITDSTEISAFPQDCNSVDTAIQTLKKTYSPEDLNALNQLFKKCLPDVPLETRYQWLAQSDQVYTAQISKLPKKVQDYVTEMSDEVGTLDPKALAQLYKKMTPQEQYVAKNQKQLFLYQYNEGEGYYSVSQDPRYAFEIFAPSLPEADQVYLKESLKQDEATGGSIDKDAGLSVSFTQLGGWITFWENYLKQYPKSHFSSQVQNLINLYQKYLFVGLENTPVFEIEEYTVKLDPDADKAIHKLAKTNSPSAEKAKKFLNYFDNYKFAETPYDETTGSQADYNLFMHETLEGIKRFEQNYSIDLFKLLNLQSS